MRNQILEPLKFYDQTAKIENERIAREYFDDLLKRSNVDVAANQKAAQDYRNQQRLADAIKEKVVKLKRIRGFLIFLIVAGILTLLLALNLASGIVKLILPLVGGAIAVVSLLIILLKIRKPLKEIEEKYQIESDKAKALLLVAQAQTSALNAMFTERDVFHVIEKTLPGIIEFSPDFTVDLAYDFHKYYDLDLKDVLNRSVVDTVSGRLFKNPFIFYRYVNHEMGAKTYYGSIVIHYTVTVRDSNGRTRIQHRTQTLTASVTKPFPCYDMATSLAYGHQCAPDLHFTRMATDVEELSDRQVERRVRRGGKKLQKKAEASLAAGGQFTEMTNTAFDVLFSAHDRDHEVQFRVMFSPLAQNNMLELLRSPVGFGDDFHFYKNGRSNVIVSEHAQRWNMYPSPTYYHSYDVEMIRNNFVQFNAEYFKSIYFDFAPLLSIPEYHQEPSETFAPIKRSGANYTFYEHEVIANAIGAKYFAHAQSVTDVILKTKFVRSEGDADCIAVTAHSYRSEQRITIIPRFGADGRMHNVPVCWTEYIPVQKTTHVVVKRLGSVNKLFHERVEKAGIADRIGSSPNAYVHGLFGKIIFGDEIRSVNNMLENLKSK